MFVHKLNIALAGKMVPMEGIRALNSQCRADIAVTVSVAMSVRPCSGILANFGYLWTLEVL